VSNYAPVRHDIWNDADFVALSPDAKLVYFLVITHQKLTRCGALDLMPSRWAKATGLTPAAVHAALDELAAARFVFIDTTTEELVVRSKVKHDKPGTWTQVKAVWRAWETVESERLRAWLAWSFPDECWRDAKAPAPIQRPIEAPCDTPSDTPCQALSDGVGDTPARTIAPCTSHSSPLTYAHPSTRSVTYKAEGVSSRPVDKLKDAREAASGLSPRLRSVSSSGQSA